MTGRVLEILEYNQESIFYYVGTPKDNSDLALCSDASKNRFDNLRQQVDFVEKVITFSDKIKLKDQKEIKTRLGLN